MCFRPSPPANWWRDGDDGMIILLLSSLAGLLTVSGINASCEWKEMPEVAMSNSLWWISHLYWLHRAKERDPSWRLFKARVQQNLAMWKTICCTYMNLSDALCRRTVFFCGYKCALDFEPMTLKLLSLCSVTVRRNLLFQKRFPTVKNCRNSCWTYWSTDVSVWWVDKL